ncbi:DUF2268 domain-containing protein [Paenibacillus sp. 481]|uniref:DUF2268 domain-containing protein n=1 Tax=Paenibacillus sp. 481 TaxID=2835869 RepID=UPI001E4A67D5|nr:DUF2268 domain-containing protein [Paenibacillus sp. 481]UHA73535.1 DUF2268 domain-containing protein [Paenibacillus sp. 481]
MNIEMMDTKAQYESLFALPSDKRDPFFRYTMMKPLETMWATIQVPLIAKQPNGYDVMMATKMMGYLDVQETEIGTAAIQQLMEMDAWNIAHQSLTKCIEYTTEAGLCVKADQVKLGMYIADPVNLKHVHGYCGFGGIPGYVMLMIHPNEYNAPRIPALIAHEFHHNIRFSYFNWNHGDVTLGDYLIIEGLADAFATELYGESMLGPWVTSIDEEELAYSIHVMKEGFGLKGFAEVSAYMFGDEAAKEQGFSPVGVSAGAGYAVGYHIVQSFMKKNNMTVLEATLLSADEIVQGSGVYLR